MTRIKTEIVDSSDRVITTFNENITYYTYCGSLEVKSEQGKLTNGALDKFYSIGENAGNMTIKAVYQELEATIEITVILEGSLTLVTVLCEEDSGNTKVELMA